MAALWTDVLGIDAVGIHDDFFALGGHSMLVTQILAGIRGIFGVELPLNAAFTETFTVSGLARQVELAQARATTAGDLEVGG